MPRTSRRITLAAALFLAPALADAQPGRDAPARPPRDAAPMARQGRPGPGGITQLLNARRELDLSPRQVAQLDSLERLQFAEHKALAERIRPVRDSIVDRARSGQRSPAFRDSIRAQAEARRAAIQPQLDQQRLRDSTRNAAADRVLSETQRTRVREMQAERRGFERGMRAGRTPQGGARGGMRGAPGGRGGMGGDVRGGMRGAPGGRGGMRRPQGPGAPGEMPARRPPPSDDR